MICSFPSSSALTNAPVAGILRERYRDTLTIMDPSNSATLSEKEHDGVDGVLVGICASEFLAFRLCLIGGDGYAGNLAVLEEEQEMTGVISGQTGEYDVFFRVHAEFGREEVTQDTCLAVVELIQPGFIALAFVGEDDHFLLICGLPVESGSITILILLITGHTQRLRCDLLEVPFLGEEYVDGIIGNMRSGLPDRRYPSQVAPAQQYV